jgi:hypothetical protein
MGNSVWKVGRALARFADMLGGQEEFPDIIEFAQSERYLGLALYPAQRVILGLIYLKVPDVGSYDHRLIEEWRHRFSAGDDVVGVPPDIWERVHWLKEHGYGHFKDVILIVGRRGSKTFMAAIIAAYEIFRLMSLGCPQENLGLDPDTELLLHVAATNAEQSRGVAFRMIASMLTRPCFEGRVASVGVDTIRLRTPRDIERFDALRAAGVAATEIGTIRIVAVSSNAPAVRGNAAFLQVFDEYAHTPPDGSRSGDENWHALGPSLDQCGKDGMRIVPTSPYSKVGIVYERYEAALATDPDTGAPLHPQMLVVQLPSWEVFRDAGDPVATEGRPFTAPLPIVYDEDLRAEELLDSRRFSVERRAQWAEVEHGFLDPHVVDRAFLPFCPDCGLPQTASDWSESDSTCARCGHQVIPLEATMREYGVMRYQYMAHGDPASLHDFFTFAVAHLQEFTESECGPVPHVIIDVLKVWKPQDYPPERILPYLEIEEEIVGIVTRYRNLVDLTFDQAGAYGTVALVERRLRDLQHPARVRKLAQTSPGNAEAAEIIKELLAQGRLHAPIDRYGRQGGSILRDELKFLQVVGDRVIKQRTGPVCTDDAYAAVSMVAAKLIKEEYGPGWRQLLRDSRIHVGLQGGYSTPSSPSPPPSRAGRTPPREALRRTFDTRYRRPVDRPPSWGRPMPWPG